MWWMLFLFLFLLCDDLNAQTQTNGPLEAPPQKIALKPPKEEMPSSVWEKHSPEILAGSALALILLSVAIYFVVRPKPTNPIPPEDKARRQLAELKSEISTSRVLMEVSDIVQHFFLERLGMPLEELTTSEFLARLRANGQINPMLIQRLETFLRGLDSNKFSPESAVADAQTIISQALAVVEEGMQAGASKTE